MVKVCLLFISMVCLSCNPLDTTPPSIDRVELNGYVNEDLHGAAGQSASIQVTSSDNESLRQVKIEFNGDINHTTHGGEPVVFHFPVRGDWVYSYTINASGAESTHEFPTKIPWQVSGPYELMVSAIDMEGNIAERYFPFMIEGDSLPVINVNQGSLPVDEDGIIQLSTGVDWTLDGYLLDTNGLALVRFKIETPEGQLLWIYEDVIPGSHVYHMDDIVFPAPEDPGKYQLTLYALDIHGMDQWKTAHLSVN